MRHVVVVWVVLLGAVAIFEYLNFSGFCYSEHRYPSDAELITNAIKNNLARHSPQQDSTRRKIYSSIEEFYQQNPDCCVLFRWDSGPFGSSILLRLIGTYQAVVDIVYRINDDGRGESFYGSMTIVNSCGTVLEVRGAPLEKI